jgi:hypothetical protein
MATIGRFGSSSIQKLPWANLGRPWQPEDFDRRRNQDAAKAIAEFVVVKAGVHAVLAPTHLLEQLNDAWRPIDLRRCEALRHELDKCGGSDIAVDYQLITTSTLLKEDSSRGAFLADITQMPIENVGYVHPDLAQRPREQVHANSLRQSVIFMQRGDRWSLTWREDLPR